MAHASIQSDLPDLPEALKARLVPYRADEIADGLCELEFWHPGLFDAMLQTIALLESRAGIERVAVDYDADDALYPATIWAHSSFPLDERLSRIVELEDMTDDVLQRYPDLVLVAIL